MDQILIIDDDGALCELVTEYLEPLGFEIESVHRGDIGAERALAGGHSIVVLDVNHRAPSALVPVNTPLKVPK